jgi:hypothetical protein
MIFEMITGDIATFGVIYSIVITAFGQGMFCNKRYIPVIVATEVTILKKKELALCQQMLK